MEYRPITPGSQCDRVMDFLKQHGSITQNDCDNMRPKIKRLASRISDLVNIHGVLIQKERESIKNADGVETMHWSRYHLPTEEELTE